jgi:predicted nucleic acid-binding protein
VIGIADTGFLVAFANRKDKFHDWALAIAEATREPLLTCEAVLTETAFHLQSVSIRLAHRSHNLGLRLRTTYAPQRRYNRTI